MNEPKSPTKARPVAVRRLPVVIHAVQWIKDMDMMFGGSVDYSDFIDGYDMDQKPRIYTLEGAMTGNDRDWIMIGIKKERWFCANDVFRQTYEVVR